MNKIAVIGAGKTGRGFLARLLMESGEKVYFVDKDEELVRALNEAESYAVHFFGNVRPDFIVSGYEAHTWKDADLSDADLILVSVGGMNLDAAGKKLSEKLSPNRRINIITCENSSKPSMVLAKAVGEDFNLSVSESTVFCTTIESSGSKLDINSENYPYLQYNADLLPEFKEDLAGIRPIHDFGNFLTRKLYTYNAASCVLAYLGYAKGYTDYREAGRDPEILEKLDENYRMTNQVLCQEFGYEEKDQEEFAALSRAKFTSQVIADTIARNAREPQRKLGSDERIIGPMKLIYKHGMVPRVLIETAAAALKYGEGEAWLKIRKEHTPGQILEEICGLEKGEFLYEEILKAY